MRDIGDDVDVPVLRKDGSIVYANVVGNPLVYLGRQCIAAFFRDVTERKQAEEALRREHRTLKHLLQSSDHERQTIAYEIHDGSPNSLAGGHHAIPDLQPPEGNEAQRGSEGV